LLTTWGSDLLITWGSDLLTTWGSDLLTAWGSDLLTTWVSDLLTTWGSDLLTAWGSDFHRQGTKRSFQSAISGCCPYLSFHVIRNTQKITENYNARGFDCIFVEIPL